MVLIFPILLVMVWAWKRKSISDKIRKADNDPTNNVKSDSWIRKNELLK